MNLFFKQQFAADSVHLLIGNIILLSTLLSLLFNSLLFTSIKCSIYLLSISTGRLWLKKKKKKIEIKQSNISFFY